MPISYWMTDKIIAITPWEIEHIKKWKGNPNKIKVIKNGMSGVFLKRVKSNNFKKNHNITGKIILFFGRLSSIKGPEILAEVGKEIVQEKKDLNLVFVGPDGGMKKEIKKIIKGIDRIYLLDPIFEREKIAEMYQAADVYCLPSYREGLPLTLFEAMASGLPIIASPVNGIPYEMEEPNNGFFVKYGDKENLKKTILKILDNEELAKKIKKNNIKKAKKYDWDIIANQYMSVYNSLIENNS